jgi:alcohol dehydrogenase YqhD (iron-dependent ADH family)
MLDFNYVISTKIFFGKNKVEKLGEELKCYGKNILFVYGEGSIKKTGLYDLVTNIFTRNFLVYHELSSVQPNPRITSVRQGIKLCREHDIECIVAVGGGSVIDAAKTIATGVFYQGDPWEMFHIGDSTVKKALPVGTILTVAGTGSEMNGNAVISMISFDQNFLFWIQPIHSPFQKIKPQQEPLIFLVISSNNILAQPGTHLYKTDSQKAF